MINGKVFAARSHCFALPPPRQSLFPLMLVGRPPGRVHTHLISSRRPSSLAAGEPVGADFSQLPKTNSGATSLKSTLHLSLTRLDVQRLSAAEPCDVLTRTSTL